MLLRHGQTELSVQRRYSGHGDPELTALGHAQAAARPRARLGELPDVAAVLSRRCAGPGRPPPRWPRPPARRWIVRDGLIETDFGGWEGLTFAEARERDPELHASWLGSEDVAPPGGESFADGRAAGRGRARAMVAALPGGRRWWWSATSRRSRCMLRLALQGGPGILYRLHLDLA